VHALVRYLLCDPEAVPGYDDNFSSWKASCVHRGLRADSQACCGIEKKLPLCPTEDADDTVTFSRWVPMERGKNKDTGSPFMSTEFVPVKATAGEFIREFRERLAEFIKHWHHLRWTRHHWKTVTRLRQKDALWQTTVATVNADFASQIEQARHAATHSSIPQRTNNCVIVVGAGGYEEEMTFRRRCKRQVHKQHVHAFQCLFPSSYKADAHAYNLMMEDIQCLLKFGRSIHCEWFLGGKRFPREGGHEVELEAEDPLMDMNTEEAQVLKREGGGGIEKLLVKTDTCQAQFGGRNNIGRVSEQHSEHCGEHQRQIAVTHTFSEPYHGKCICDAMSNVPASELRREGALGKVFPGAREQVLHLARKLQIPGVDKSRKVEWWAVSNFVWGYLNTDSKRFPVKPDFKPLPGSKGMAMYQSVNRRGGVSRVRVRRRHCMCAICLPRTDSNSSMGEAGCLVLNDHRFSCMVGRSRIAHMQRKERARTTIQLRARALLVEPGVAQEPEGDAFSLERFARSFRVNEVVAVNVANDDKDMYGEGDFWLAVAIELPKKLDRTIRHGGSVVEGGTWGVRCLRLNLCSTTISEEGGEQRQYRVADHSEVVLDVRAVLQLPPDGETAEVGDVYFIGMLEDHKGDFILSPEQTAHISACLGEMESAFRDSDPRGLTDTTAADEESEAA